MSGPRQATYRRAAQQRQTCACPGGGSSRRRAAARAGRWNPRNHNPAAAAAAAARVAATSRARLAARAAAAANRLRRCASVPAESPPRDAAADAGVRHASSPPAADAPRRRAYVPAAIAPRALLTAAATLAAGARAHAAAARGGSRGRGRRRPGSARRPPREELGAAALDLSALLAQRDGLRRAFARRKNAFRGFADLGEAAAAYFPAGLGRDLFCAVARAGAAGASAAELAAQLGEAPGAVGACLEAERAGAGVFRRVGARWHLPTIVGQPGAGAQRVWPCLLEALRGWPAGLPITARPTPYPTLPYPTLTPAWPACFHRCRLQAQRLLTSLECSCLPNSETGVAPAPRMPAR
jgi:hypothetical protein